MSEKEKTPFNMRKAAQVGLGLTAGLTAVGLLAQGAVNAEKDQDREERLQAAYDLKQEYKDTIEAAVNAAIDQETIVGSFTVEQGDAVIDKAEDVIKAQYGDAYDPATKYDTLLYSAQQLNPQPGDKIHVIELELNGNKDDGDELIVSNGPIKLEPGQQIPSPTFGEENDVQLPTINPENE